jgi:hypothetical protein
MKSIEAGDSFSSIEAQTNALRDKPLPSALSEVEQELELLNFLFPSREVLEQKLAEDLTLLSLVSRRTFLLRLQARMRSDAPIELQRGVQLLELSATILSVNEQLERLFQQADLAGSGPAVRAFFRSRLEKS